MIELAVGALGVYVIARLVWEVASLNSQLLQAKSQRDSAYRAVTEVRDSLIDAEEYIDKLEGVSGE